MNRYISVKMVEAEPMLARTFNERTGRKAREGEDPCEEGYLVQYPDGYQGWCPKGAFERTSFALADDTGKTVGQEDRLNFMGPDPVERKVETGLAPGWRQMQLDDQHGVVRGGFVAQDDCDVGIYRDTKAEAIRHMERVTMAGLRFVHAWATLGLRLG